MDFLCLIVKVSEMVDFSGQLDMIYSHLGRSLKWRQGGWGLRRSYWPLSVPVGVAVITLIAKGRPNTLWVVLFPRFRYWVA